MSNGNESAYPNEVTSIGRTGLTKRELFAAHAPEVPEWWIRSKPEIEPMPEMPESIEENMETWKGWGDYLEDEDVPAELLPVFKSYRLACDQRATRNDIATRRANFETLVSWRRAYASAMLEEDLRDPSTLTVAELDAAIAEINHQADVMEKRLEALIAARAKLRAAEILDTAAANAVAATR